jgi:ABC-type branched-subunit amino acid transport system permease subunit
MALLAGFTSAPSERPGPLWWLFVAALMACVVALPFFLDISQMIDISILLILALLALSMSFLWGYVGILSFGQTAFFGLGGYAYAVAALNFDDTNIGLVLALALPMAFAAVLGYFMIYGRISDIYLSVITLVVTLILDKAIRATSGEEYVIGTVRLNGQNGIPTVPSLRLPWDQSVELFFEGVFWVAGGCLVLVYVGLRLLLTTHFGRVLVGLRENERRMQLLGYDSRRYKLGAFVLSGGIAALSGILYATWGNFVAPEMFNLHQAAQVIIWVIVGGKSTLLGPVLGTALVQTLTKWLGSVQILPSWLGAEGVAGQVPLVLGLVLLIFVLAFQQGLLPSLGSLAAALRRRLRVR